MINNDLNKMTTFRYNLSFYYQSTLIYFSVFALYIVIRGKFVEDSFTLITRDPIIYFFGIIVLISIVALVNNLYKKRHIEVSDQGISFINRFGRKSFSVDEIRSVKVPREITNKKPLRLVRIKLKARRRPLIIRPYNYENENELVQRFRDLKQAVEKSSGKNV